MSIIKESFFSFNFFLNIALYQECSATLMPLWSFARSGQISKFLTSKIMAIVDEDCKLKSVNGEKNVVPH